MEHMLPEIPRLHTALAEWAACMIFVAVLQKRFKGWKLLTGIALGLVVQCLFQIFAGELPLNVWIISMLSAILLMFLWIYGFCKVSFYDAAYSCIRAFVLAEFAASLEWQVYCYFIYKKMLTNGYLWEVGILFLVYGIVYFIAYRLELYFVPGDRHVNVHLREVLSSAVIGIVAFSMSNIGFVYADSLFSARYDAEIFIVRTIMNFGALAVLYAHYILKADLRSKQELNAIRNVLQRQFDQYELYKDNIELLNLKYHDMKNQIEVIRAEKDSDKKEGYLNELEKHLKIYKSWNKTGNQVLDTVLTSKNLICVEHEIALTCVVNGKILDFMDAMDICTIFGNALDNAIECEKQIADKKERMIHVTVFSKNNFIMMRFENYFQGELKNVVEGLPQTTKKSQVYHGYGLKSIRYSVECYGGTVTISKTNDWFELKILIPKKSKVE